MRLQQRLKRSLQSEHSIRNANEDLLLKLHEAEPAEAAAEVRTGTASDPCGRHALSLCYLISPCPHVD